LDLYVESDAADSRQTDAWTDTDSDRHKVWQ